MSLFEARVQAQAFDLATEQARLSELGQEVGAIVSFTGQVRGEVLELEHYPGMAEAEISRIAAQACERWPVTDLLAIHRFGKISPGGNIVLVIAASPHREAAFSAASFLMDYLKTRAPFWKKEHRKDGTSGEWVSAKDKDDEALKRWE